MTTTVTAPSIQPVAAASNVSDASGDADDWLSGVTACSIENGADCEACQ